MSRSLATSLLLAFLAGALAEDTPPQVRPVAPAAKPPAPRTVPVPEPITGTRCRITLRTKKEIEGVLRVPGVYERRNEKGVFEPCERGATDSGVRLWYIQGRPGSIFYPAAQVESVEKLGVLTETEAREIARRIAEAAQYGAADREKLRKERESKAAAELAMQKAAAAAAAAKPAADPLAGFADLFREFPPGEWSPEIREEILRRNRVLHIRPTVEEAEFLRVYPEWFKGYELRRALENAAKDAPSGE